MRHNRSYSKLNRTSAHRRALLRNLATSLFVKGNIETTLAKAKELRPIAEKLITLGRSDTVPARRQAYSYLESKEVVHKLFTEIGPSFKTRPGGYTRIVRTRLRNGDAAELASISLLESETKHGESKPAAKKEPKGEAKKTVKKQAKKEAKEEEKEPKKAPAAKKSKTKKAETAE